MLGWRHAAAVSSIAPLKSACAKDTRMASAKADAAAVQIGFAAGQHRGCIVTSYRMPKTLREFVPYTSLQYPAKHQYPSLASDEDPRALTCSKPLDS